MVSMGTYYLMQIVTNVTVAAYLLKATWTYSHAKEIMNATIIHNGTYITSTSYQILPDHIENWHSNQV